MTAHNPSVAYPRRSFCRQEGATADDGRDRIAVKVSGIRWGTTGRTSTWCALGNADTAEGKDQVRLPPTPERDLASTARSRCEDRTVPSALRS